MPKVMFVDLMKHFYDQQGVFSLIGFLRKHNIDVHFIAERNWIKALNRINIARPELLLYSSFSTNIHIYVAFDKMIKKVLKVKSLIGGVGVTFDPECIKGTTIDAACTGEGEFALVDFIKEGFQGNKNIFLRGQGAPSEFYPFLDLDKLPFPDRGIVYKENALLRDMPSKQFLSGRGCPYECTYCFNHKFNEIFKGCGPVVRKKSVSYLFDEVRVIKKNYPLNNVVFSDDTFILDKKWFFEFCERFPKEIGITYTCTLRANLVDENVVKGLSESGCIGVCWSIESGDEYLRNTILRRQISDEQILNTAALLGKYKIPSRIGNIIGLPGENPGQMLETLELNIKAGLSRGLVQGNIFVPFPRTALTQYAIEKGYYTPVAELPKNIYQKPLMNVSKKENKFIRKLSCLFPVFAKFPYAYRNPLLKEALFSFPFVFLKLLFRFSYGWGMMKIYVWKSSFRFKCRLITEYFRGYIY